MQELTYCGRRLSFAPNVIHVVDADTVTLAARYSSGYSSVYDYSYSSNYLRYPKLKLSVMGGWR